MSHFAMRPVTTQKVTSSGSSAASSAFGANIEYVRVIADADCHIAVSYTHLTLPTSSQV